LLTVAIKQFCYGSCGVLIGSSKNHSASDFVSGIAGRLTGKIIGHTVDDNRSSDNVLYRETFIIKDLIGVALIAQKRRKISGMLGMRPVPGIVMISGLIKRRRAVPIFMDMNAVKITGALCADVGKSKDFGFYENASVRCLIKFYGACELGL
jgi:hypothetical protein